MNHPELMHQFAREHIDTLQREARNERLARSVSPATVRNDALRRWFPRIRLHRPAFLQLARG